MDPKVAALAENMRIWRVQEYVQLGVFASIFWYYVTTLKEESKYIWPVSNRKAGKILYYTTRISFAIYAIANTLNEFPTHLPLSVATCNALRVLDFVMGRISSAAVDAILWMCLYALIQGKKKHFFILAIIFTVYQVGYTVIASISTSYDGSRAVPQSTLDAALGYSCTWDWVVTSESALFPISQIDKAGRYLLFSTQLLFVLVGVGVLVVQYRNQQGRLINVIRRECGLFYIAAISISIVLIITTAPNMRKLDPYAITNSIKKVTFIFCDRLLLLLRQSDDMSTQKLVSNLVFGGDSDSKWTDGHDSDVLKEHSNGRSDVTAYATDDLIEVTVERGRLSHSEVEEEGKLGSSELATPNSNHASRSNTAMV